ncbi:hypothetical protein C5167_018116 [Papaver somniferum]|uniref:Fe2OG dioxygenase domain-containing protein n=1 Tax=Papaver somniferum TaxID=3469 RepID=A0A4Y7IPG1_PAPSO|nr:thebaine 6-O-demethylase-like [Papaver somniferum]RZC49690.1 hypothetical protein C5167_018116 [Papaver somniferum]
MKQLSMVLFNKMENALQVQAAEIKGMSEVFKDRTQAMRMNYYPPCPKPNLAIGLTSHSDFGGLTILLQINEVEGLQIKKDGTWISVKPLPNAFVVNVGDIMEVFI